ncbi:CoA activase [Desulfobacter hydrogenophilus]|uniref:CoA activase n=1 Tax=Desulfobacter hydrogenophilus TaxID=2291 RepID=A0A328FHC9_9BACT|nr:acyl-CoA dehydratase activase [Desulfobacter hydrogenophilus]NDY71649.1 CoA activase [Desulfobacter hydrogenophilus]QBH15426.1 CoA activase [Desulfobacter hydrogenophilus]RAM02503.1 CoA activase [Desulfobacter hydrogenophilus]
MEKSTEILGIDVGSVSVHLAIVDMSGNLLHKASEYHHGDVRACLAKMLAHKALSSVTHVAKTASTPADINATISVDEQVAVIRSARHVHKNFSAILHVGGEKFFLSLFDNNGNYRGQRQNSGCAAGTGAFLDQQAGRIDLQGSEKISSMALENCGQRPDIATRCAVFAKTDLIHAQQQGYNLKQICDGLCYGLARNIANTLFKQDIPEKEIIFCGGVAKNNAVKKHLESIIGKPLVKGQHALVYGAMGAALCLTDKIMNSHEPARSFNDISNFFLEKTKTKKGLNLPLDLTLSDYPDFSSVTTLNFESVEIEIFKPIDNESAVKGFLGLDVGSTSTKSIIIDQDGESVAGFYTQTASRPVEAVQRIFKACDHLMAEKKVVFRIQGCGTTGSGRRISGKIIGADLEPDEITAHATAAVNLHPDVDTIIEIGGQDAKFTLVKNGQVTSSVMNAVCAAGTGSFIEEQAMRLNCPLSEYSHRAQGIAAPVSSDRCTVFMERDINYFFAEGYGKNEILASVLHSVRDNYLTKVANIAQIGDRVVFQGATARNKALVAAFEQKLNKPIHVSRYCHLTGALGIALMARQMKAQGELPESCFKGFNLWQEHIPVRQEVCRLCTNHCKITIAEVKGETLAYGFLCGRDYQTKKRVSSSGRYDLLGLRKEVRHKTLPGPPVVKGNGKQITIGLPNALHMVQDLDFWQLFFKELGLQVVTSRKCTEPVKQGKQIAGAEFCAPVLALHGHVQFLEDKCDYIFLPFYFEDKTSEKGFRRHHCYYTQFAPAILSRLAKPGKILSPMVRYLYTSFYTKKQLYDTFKKIGANLSFFDISSAWDRALSVQKDMESALTGLWASQGSADRANVLLLGRPYTVLSSTMNNNIPDIFATMGIKTFFNDMIDIEGIDYSPIEPLLKQIHWKHAAQNLKAAFVAATTPNLYPVYISSFRCAPDAFAVDYFKEIMASANKPYLVLELDEHDSSVGYETRIEAAVRAFENHRRKDQPPQTTDASLFTPKFDKSIDQKTVIFPNWDAITGHLIVNIIKNEGYNAILMEENQDTLKKALLTNTGQCLPLNAVAAGFIHTVEKKGLSPENTVLWLNQSDIACNIKMYPYHIQKILTRHGNGFEKARVYLGELSLFDLGIKASTNTYFAYMFGGLFRSIGCRIRPYEINKGQTNAALCTAGSIMGTAFLTGGSKEKALKEIMPMFEQIPVKKETRPKVGIFGDLYVRDNRIMNQNLIQFIEDNGGEVVTTPYYQYVQIIANAYFKKWFKEGKYLSLISNKALLAAVKTIEKKYYPFFAPFFNETELKVNTSYEHILETYGMLPEHTGESMDNLLKIHYIVNEHPNLALLVAVNPAFCCPGLITEAMASQIEKKVGVPIINITYDLSGGNKNKAVVPFLKYLRTPTYSQSRKASV